MNTQDSAPLPAGSLAVNLSSTIARSDEQAIIEALRQIEMNSRPGIVVAYYNGANWMLYEQNHVRWLPRE